MQMLNISKKIYVGWSTNVHDLPDVQITPVGTAINEKNKVKKLTNRYKETKEYENEALPGFTLLRSESRGWSSREVDWLVIDPRGFICRITSENMNAILAITGITEGLIQEKCVWARNDSETKLSLIPVNSPGYDEAIKNTVLIDNKVDKTDIGYGDTVLLQNGMKGRYMGTESLYGAMDYRYSSSDYSGKANVWCRRQIIEVTPGLFYYGTNIKMLKVLDEADKPMSREECVEYMNDQIKNHKGYFATREDDDGKQYWSKPGSVRLVSSAAVAKPTLSFLEIDRAEAEEIHKACHKTGDKYQLVLENNAGKFIIEYPYGGGRGSAPTVFTAEPIKGFDSTQSLVVMSRGRNAFNNFGSQNNKKLDDFTKFYKIVKHVKTDSYV